MTANIQGAQLTDGSWADLNRESEHSCRLTAKPDPYTVRFSNCLVKSVRQGISQVAPRNRLRSLLILAILCGVIGGCGTTPAPERKPVVEKEKPKLKKLNSKRLSENSVKFVWESRYGQSLRAVVTIIKNTSYTLKEEKKLVEDYLAAASEQGKKVALEETGRVNEKYRYYRLSSVILDKKQSDSSTFLLFGPKVIEVILPHPGQEAPLPGQLDMIAYCASIN